MSAWLLSDQRASGRRSESASPAQVFIELELAACKALALKPKHAIDANASRAQGPGAGDALRKPVHKEISVRGLLVPNNNK